MNVMKKKSMAAAVMAGLAAAGAVGTAEAVHINPDGLGQVLIYPYYTARAASTTSDYNTLFSVVNTTNQYKVVKVRFLEGRASREVLDFNLFLSPADVWTGAVVPTANGARVVTADNSCVAPSDLFNRAGSPDLADFKNLQYTGAPYSLAGVSLDRTREGYIEVLEMAIATTAQVQGYIKHSAGGIPGNCVALDAMDPAAGNAAAVSFPGAVTVAPATTFLNSPTGGLAGRGVIVNPNTGANYAYNAVAIDAWTGDIEYTESGSTAPNLGSGNLGSANTANIFVNGGVISQDYASAIDAISATMMRDTVINEFVLDAGTASQTDWVVTFPTKREYVTAAVSPPFSNAFGASGACDPYSPSVFNREEGSPSGPTVQLLPSPRPGAIVEANALCWEANVVPFQASSLLASRNTNSFSSTIANYVSTATSTTGTRTSVAAGTVQGPNGWMFMSFNTRATQRLIPAAARLNGVAIANFNMVSATDATLNIGRAYGLPVVGFMVHNFNRTGVVSQYGNLSDHKYTRLIPTT
ncbi:MAG: hypothetical protein JNJ55_02555 [Betaproteobacteria bacterium]|nr:hypothetical protein [Betaproteobacteria bacterium]